MANTNKALDGVGLARVAQIIRGWLAGKQDKLTGTAGQVVGFDAMGNAVAQAGVTYSTTAPLMDGTASVGSAATVARSDHKHPTDTTRAASNHTHTASDVGAAAVNHTHTAADVGAAAANHTHSAADIGAAASSHGTHVTCSTTAPVMDGTASAGTAATVARSDHKHPTDTTRAASNHTHTAADVGAAAASHGTHVTYSTTAPVMDGTASAGSAATVARSDHKHPTDTTRAASNHTHTAADVGAAAASHTHTAADVGAAASSHGTHVSYSTTAPLMDGTASVGSAATVARSDHKHPTDTSRAASNHTHTAADVGARPSTWMPSAADVGAMPLSSGRNYVLSDFYQYITGTHPILCMFSESDIQQVKFKFHSNE